MRSHQATVIGEERVNALMLLLERAIYPVHPPCWLQDVSGQALHSVWCIAWRSCVAVTPKISCRDQEYLMFDE